MDFGKLTVKELKQGYRRDETGGAFTCNICGECFADGQVYPVDGKYFTPEHAAKHHVADAHGGSAAVLIHAETKYNSLTENQKDLLMRFAAGETDREIARELQISEATVRRQRFNFREKAKQAKHYLAVYEQVFETGGKDTLMPIHDKAVFLDDRYVITETGTGAHHQECIFKPGSACAQGVPAQGEEKGRYPHPDRRAV